MKKSVWLIAFAWLIGTIASTPFCLEADGADDPSEMFFEQAQLIMTKVELEIYKHLADDKARDEFMADFWKKRDPTPLSEENEFKEDFAKRVEFARRWFQEGGAAGRGWDSDRGRILLMVGFPDQRDQLPMLDRPRAKAVELWVYHRFGAYVEFVDREGFGRFILERWPLELIDAIEQVKALGGSAGKENYFRFTVSCTPAGLRIEIPTQTVVVEERGDGVRSAFALSVDVFCDYVKLERLALTREFIESREAFTERESFILDVPYAFPKPGKYLMDIIVDELVSRQRFREVARCKRTGKI